ncbi:substrate binding domain-containing protein [Mangrovitalea sediminis]|uniref:substrate binding domain-containing protein n=1 Tax=Mangrovitalea sediminis TaxID=1982043 RepID=UPI0013040109|nr:substrate binding domain-containing protein [Mangrovitalea sediminis]
MDVIADYREHYPEVDVELSITDRVVDLVDEGFHVAIRTGDEIHQDLIARPLSPYRMLACASPAYLASHPPIEKPQDLEGHQCLAFAQWGRHPVWRFQQGNDIRTVPVSGGFRSDSVLALRRAAINGQGVTVQAETLVAEPIANGQLQQVLPGWQLRARPTLIVWPPHMRNSAKLRSFVDFVTEHMGDVNRG